MRARPSSLLAGIVAGIRFAAKSLEPSLMPRSAIDQGLIMGGSFLTGFLAASGLGRIIGLLGIPGSSSAVRAVGMAAAAGRSAQLLGTDDSDEVPVADEGEAWAEAGSEVLSAMALSGVGAKGSPPIASGLTLAGVGVSTALEAKVALDRRPDDPDPKYVATASAVGLGLNLVLGAVIAGIFYAARTIARKATSKAPLRFLIGTGVSIVMLNGLVNGLAVAFRRVLGRIAAGNRQTEVSYAEPPESNAVSGSQYSIASYETLGLQGRRLVSEYTPEADIEQIMGESPRSEPVRVYIGLGTADSEDDRVEMAIQELRRAGGFERSTIIAASPAGTGYVNYIAIEAAELMSRGDVATVAVQYGEVPSMLSITKVGEAARVYAKLLRRLRDEIDGTGREIRLAAYGESLGAITCQMGVLEASGSSDAPIVDLALWVGTPQGSKLFSDLTADGVPVFDHFDDLVERRSEGLDDPDVFFLNHDNDPVTKFNPKIAIEMPDWLVSPGEGRNMEPNQRWLPGVTFWQTLIDTKNAATVVPGEFKSTGHDYRADLAEFVRAAYGFDDISSDQMERIEARLRTSEVVRADRIAEGRVENTESPSEPVQTA